VAVHGGPGEALGEQPAARRGHVVLADLVQRLPAQERHDAQAELRLGVRRATQALPHVREVPVAGEVGEQRHRPPLRLLRIAQKCAGCFEQSIPRKVVGVRVNSPKRR